MVIGAAAQRLLLPTDSGFANVWEMATLAPTVGAPVTIFRASAADWIIRTPLVAGPTTSFTEWHVVDIGSVIATTRCFVLAGLAVCENGVRRGFTNYNLDNSVFEYAINIGLMADPINGGTWARYGNAHGFVTYTGLSINMDGGATNLRDIAIGTASQVAGSSLAISQTFDIRLPKNNTVIGNINSAHTFDVNGCLVSVVHNITASGIGEQNSYTAMFPLDGCDVAKFGSNVVAFNRRPAVTTQSGNMGKQTTFEAWNSARPQLRVKMVLPQGGPGLPDGFTNVTTTDSFYIDQPEGWTKIYVNGRSGGTAIAANTTKTCATQYSAYLAA